MGKIAVTNFSGVNVQSETDLKEISVNDYFNSLDCTGNIILISCLDDASKNWGLFNKKNLLGLSHNIGWRESYIALVDISSSFIYEEHSKSLINYSYKFPFGIDVNIISAGYGVTPLVSKIYINGIDYSKNKRGLNFVIYNKKDKKVVDSFNCDFFGDSNLLIRRFSVISDFNKRIEKLNYGLRLALQYCKLDNSVLYFILNSHLGDAARDLKILKPILMYYGIDAPRYHFTGISASQDGIYAVKNFSKKKLIAKICIITSKSISGVVKLYEEFVDEVIVFPKKELEAIELYAFSQCGPHENIVPDENAPGLLQRWNFDETDWTKWMMFKVNSLMWKFCLPREVMTHQANMMIGESTKVLSDKVISDYQIDVLHTAILCPVSRSSSNLPKAIWVKFTQFLRTRGYEVYTNVGPDELPVEETKALSVDVDVVVGLAHKGVKVIGVQCGLMDILVWSKASNLLIVNVIRSEQDKAFAQVAGAVQEVNNKPNNVTYLRIEHFEEDYVLKLLMDNFH